jgi:cytochrome c oxidase assembly factor CtaG
MEFWRFLGQQTDLSTAVEATYNPYLVVLSFIIASIAGYSALELSEKISNSTSKLAKTTWLISGAFSMSGGICNGLMIQDTELDIIIKTNEVNNEFKTNFYK